MFYLRFCEFCICTFKQKRLNFSHVLAMPAKNNPNPAKTPIFPRFMPNSPSPVQQVRTKSPSTKSSKTASFWFSASLATRFRLKYGALVFLFSRSSAPSSTATSPVSSSETKKRSNYKISPIRFGAAEPTSVEHSKNKRNLKQNH